MTLFLRLKCLLVCCFIALLSIGSIKAQEITIGSKKFTESVVLGEITTHLLRESGVTVEHKQRMGGTIIVWEALKNGDIDIYPDYTGTIRQAILKSETDLTFDQMQGRLLEYGVAMTGKLGFNNTYAIAMRQDRASSLEIQRISDLKSHPSLTAGLTHEFLNRQDGWKSLSAHYGLQMENVKGMAHELAYVALRNDEIDLMEAYSTDAKLLKFELTVLIDDLEFFPKYDAVFLYRHDTDPKSIAIIKTLEETIDEKLMMQLNQKAEKEKDYTVAASLYFSQTKSAVTEESTSSSILTPMSTSFTSKVAKFTFQHLKLVLLTMIFAVLIGVPLGIIASRPGIFSQLILGVTGIIYTIPSLCLFALFIPFLGTSEKNAITALVLYALLPIVHNTATGLQNISVQLRESAAAIGLKPSAQLTKIFLPMASRTILSGIKTSGIMTVALGTIAAFIGVGGLGEPILSGIDLNAPEIYILQGAIPVALLALLIHFLFEFLDRVLIPRGLRQGDDDTQVKKDIMT
ncbi:TPA: ABC transporter permease subunit [Candidatus Poribacteria bacterium]|nr:ABC transporter permease subunit [Candidatus Poribacteria bacterium]HIA67444.1 ABC transporter permease subunit [Candidatus Poribacteria bacterium]HIB89912.1 ABC transporter permease subunit [Candidatus Poribacteria bacterium]HIB98626.1 ABC transporter permease subunit [Candidatus Poribacteria bacterium]HIN30271.1 ABC transporter permease subunit [Candidatus Poribacteria bacterium]